MKNLRQYLQREIRLTDDLGQTFQGIVEEYLPAAVSNSGREEIVLRTPQAPLTFADGDIAQITPV